MLENLTDIRERTRGRRKQGRAMSSWSFAQLQAFVAYKQHTEVSTWSLLMLATVRKPAPVVVTSRNAIVSVKVSSPVNSDLSKAILRIG